MDDYEPIIGQGGDSGSEGGSDSGLGYNANQDLAQSAGFKTIIEDLGNDNDQAGCGELYLFEPSNTTYVKHFVGKSSNAHGSDYAQEIHYQGYCNTTTAIDGVRFKMSSGNIDSGVIKLYGIS